ncbi:DUF1360 domain-containing protein [Streptomyces sp. SPB162]|uniref:DUF1360 domain-containing protein n=1 Tax=Streptomyces sp. SPB162 TaxID=2940560 RepID=UPI002405D4F1|nr:DUF1360 domain-containing protein [Streptomyces sp. SPB162]MDF9817011.1 hypothetical protein [Streptomyces sp. SPB162]
MGITQGLRSHGGHLGAVVGFAGYTAGWTMLQRRSGRPLPAAPGPWELLLTATATFRLSRLIGKASVTRPLRAPFTEVEGAGAPAELNETPREEPGRKTVGELISCPFCLSVWIVTGFVGARAVWPEATRTATGALTALTVSDALQFGYSVLSERADH